MGQAVLKSLMSMPSMGDFRPSGKQVIWPGAQTCDRLRPPAARNVSSWTIDLEKRAGRVGCTAERRSLHSGNRPLISMEVEMRTCRVLLLCLVLPLMIVSAFAQPQIESAQANLYFPQIVSGGPTSAQWQTTFTFANPNPATARCTLFLLSDGGQAFEM